MGFKFPEMFEVEYWNALGYLPGLGRDFPYPPKAHLYRGSMNDVGDPMCKRGWNRDKGRSFSIWRNNVGEDGICGNCINAARREITKKTANEVTK